jgi:hypothetical protein
MNVDQLVLDYLDKYPTAPKRTIAKLLRSDFPEHFSSIEQARSKIRYYTGDIGAHSKKCGRNAKRDKYIDQERRTKIVIPKGESRQLEPFVIEDGSWLVTGDWHIPYHDHDAIQIMLNYALEKEIENVYLNGDILDFYQASQWVRDPRKRSIQGELEILWDVLDILTKNFKKVIYKVGNHEDRYTRLIWTQTPQLACLPHFDIDKVLNLSSRDIKMVESKQNTMFGSLWGFHGHELPRGLTNPVNIARGLCLRVREPSFTNHWHVTSTHVEPGGVTKKQKKFFSIGCMCDLSPDYAPINKWNLGFATITVEGKGYQFDNYTVMEGKVFGT